MTELIGHHDWIGMAEGPKPTMFAMKSNFKAGRMSKPPGQLFECKVVTMPDQTDNLGTLFFRWIGPEKVLTEEEKEEQARQKVLAKLAELENGNAVVEDSERLPAGEPDGVPDVRSASTEAVISGSDQGEDLSDEVYGDVLDEEPEEEDDLSEVEGVDSDTLVYDQVTGLEDL